MIKETTINEVCGYLHNDFVKKIIGGVFKIENGMIDLPDAIPGQYIKISGSVMNDGIHVYPCVDLIDEEFDGAVGLMSCPPDFLAICDEIDAWGDKFGETSVSPFMSESFGGYSYQKANYANSSNDQSFVNSFKMRLRRWKKV